MFGPSFQDEQTRGTLGEIDLIADAEVGHVNAVQTERKLSNEANAH